MLIAQPNCNLILIFVLRQNAAPRTILQVYKTMLLMMDNFFEKKGFVPALFVGALLVYLLNSWGVSIYILDEAKNASCAREMLETHNAFVPTFNQVLRTDKPPLHYFFMMLAYKMFGINPFAARFFSACFGALTILITFVYTRRFFNAEVAGWTAIVLLASVHLSIQFHLAVPDPFLIFFMTWSMLAFFAAYKTAALAQVVSMYIAIALGILAKGPVALLLPGLVFLLFLVFTHSLNRTSVGKFKPVLGIAVVTAVALPWFLVNGIKTQWEWPLGFLGEHNLNRFTGAKEGHGGNFLLPLLFVLLGLFPFSIFLPRALRVAFNNKQKPFVLFNIIAGFTIVGFFSISQTKLPNYTVPAYPFLAILIGGFISQKKHSFRRLRIEYFVLLLLSIAVPISAFFALKSDPSLAAVRKSSLWLLVLPVFVVFACFFRRKLHNFMLLIAGGGLTTAVVFFTLVFPQLDRQNPVVKSRQMLVGKEVAYYKKFNPAFSFYLKKEIHSLDENDFEQFFQHNPDGIIISTKSKIEAMNSSADYEIVFSGKDLFERPTTVLLKKKNKQ